MNKQNNKKICIIGGGISGLSLAYFLSKKGFNITLFEKEKECGGLLGVYLLPGGNYIERHYHHIFKNDEEIIFLINKLGLTDKLVWHSVKSSFFNDNKFCNFSTPLDIFKISFLSFRAKIKMALGTVKILGFNLEQVKDFSAKEIIEKYMSKEIWQKLWQPLFIGKFGEHADFISASWFWSRLKLRAKSRKRGKETLGYIKGSFKIVIDVLIKKIENNNGKIIVNNKINKIEKEGRTYKINNEKFDIVVSTINLNSLEYNKSTDQNFNKINYFSAITSLLIFKKKQTDFYWTNVLNSNIPFKGIIEHTNFIEPQIYSDNHLVYLSHYVSFDSAFFNMDNENLKRTYIDYFKKIIPFNEDDLLKIKIFKEKYAQPIIDKGWKILSNKMEENFYSTSMAHIYPEDRGVNQAIKQAKKIVSYIIKKEVH